MADLTDKRNEWLTALSGEDVNSIRQQVYLLVVDLSYYMIINQARGLAAQDPDGVPKLNPIIHELIDRTAPECIMLRIRKLCESKPRDKKKDVHSLTALLDDMIMHSDLLSRAQMLVAEGLPYEIPSERSDINAHVMATIRHKAIDYLSNVRPEDRTPDDKVETNKLQFAQSRLTKRSQNIKNYVDKFIAHAATGRSRQVFQPKELRVHLALLWRSTATICKVAHFVEVCVLGDSSCTPLPTFPSCELSYLDRDLADAADIHLLKKAWVRIARKVARWHGEKMSGSDDF